jgi:ABC-type Fe3+ transport system permease subunit
MKDRRLLVNPDWAGQSHRRRAHEQASPKRGNTMYIGIGTVVLIVIIVLVVLMLRRR